MKVWHLTAMRDNMIPSTYHNTGTLKLRPLFDNTHDAYAHGAVKGIFTNPATKPGFYMLCAAEYLSTISVVTGKYSKKAASPAK